MLCAESAELKALQEKDELKRLEQQLEDMLLSQRLDYRQIIKELDHESVCSDLGKLEIVWLLYNVRLRQPDNKKLRKLINHYAIERDNMIVLKP